MRASHLHLLAVLATACLMFIGACLPRSAQVQQALERGDRELLLRQLATRREPWIQADAARGLGLLGEARALPLLLNLLSDPRALPEVRASAAFALGRIRDAAALAPLLSALRRVGEAEERYWILEALGQLCVNEPTRAHIHDALSSLPTVKDQILVHVVQQGLLRCAPPANGAPPA